MPHNRSNQYEDFLLSEYNNIANAHFNVKMSVASFFKYYLVLMSAPITLLASSYTQLNIAQKSSLYLYTNHIITASFLISLIGSIVTLYIINISLNATTYARQVNGIRKYFTENQNKLGLPTACSVLPTDVSKPSGKLRASNLLMMSACATINCSYFGLFLFLFTRNLIKTSLFCVLFFGAHFLMHKILSTRKL